MDFTNVEKFEKSSEFTYSGKRYRANVSVNPRTKKLLFSLYCNNKAVVINKVIVEGEPIFYGVGNGDFDEEIDVDFVFSTKQDILPTGNILDFKDLNLRVFLYMIVS